MRPGDPKLVRTVLQAAVMGAMKQRDRVALAAYRTALAAIDNAEAVPIGEEHRAAAIELSPIGAGRADVDRGSLTEQESRDVVRLEAQERLAAAESLEIPDADRSLWLRREAQLLLVLLDEIEQ